MESGFARRSLAGALGTQMSRTKKGPSWLDLVVIVLLVPVALVALVVVLLLAPFMLAYSTALRVLIEIVWVARGKRILLVYSRSPVWQPYIESTWVPRVGEQAVVLNWSDRATWKRSRSLAVRAYRHWAPRTEFNPMVILFTRFPRTRRISFYSAFRDWKHGNEATLRAAEAQLFEFSDELRRRGA